MKIRGTVVFEPLEGGFWGLLGNDGEQYLPIEDLPESVHQDGCEVEAVVEPVQVFSLAQWGRTVRVLSIKKI